MMLCEKCKKAIATVHLTEINGGKREENHLCEECARTMNLPHKQAISISELLGALMEKGQKKHRGSREKRECPDCGISFSEFQNNGRLGCANDYKIFEKELAQLLKKVHGSTKYIGKVPDGSSKTPIYQNELMRLKHRLKKVIQIEDYEDAARIRDRIIELEELVGESRHGAGEERD
jgi:protein arginine kinase activator